MQKLNKYSGLIAVILTIISIWSTEIYSKASRNKEIEMLSNTITQCQTDFKSHVERQANKEDQLYERLLKIETLLVEVKTEINMRRGKGGN